MALWVAIAVVTVLEVNALVDKQGLVASVADVIHMSLLSTAVLVGIIYFVQSLTFVHFRGFQSPQSTSKLAKTSREKRLRALLLFALHKPPSN